MPALCRDCHQTFPAAPRSGRCPACGSTRVLAHPELDTLSIAHLDCDAFYASVEKRDRPELVARPVIVGGGRRGVVAAACYVARRHGVRSAMPMFKALQLCPQAVVIPPDRAKYAAAGHAVRALMEALSPLVEPLSIDEAFIDLSGTQALHGGWPARTLARLARRIEAEVGVTASIGLSHNKFLAKIASDLDKPRGFAVIGRAETLDFLENQPVGLLWGVGKALRARMEADGLRTIADLRRVEESTLMRRYGIIGRRLRAFAWGRDDRVVDPEEPVKSISSETTFDADIADPDRLAGLLWPLCETVSRRLKAAELAAGSVTLKLKTAAFRQFTRTHTLDSPTRLAETLYHAARVPLRREADGRAFRLIGVGAGALVDGVEADPPDLAEPDRARRVRIESAMDRVRARFGERAVFKGRSLAGAETVGNGDEDG